MYIMYICIYIIHIQIENHEVDSVNCPTPPGPVLPTRNSSECRCAESFASGSRRISENVTRTSGCPQDVLREFPEPSEPSESRE